MNNNETKKKNRIAPILILFLLLIVLPGGSIYYLSQGFDHQVNTYKELKDYGQIPDFQLTDENGNVIEKKDITGKIVVAGFAPLSAIKSDATFQKYVYDLNEQFGDRKDLMLLVHVTDVDSLSVSDKEVIAEKYELKFPKTWKVLTGNISAVKNLAKEGYKLPQTDIPYFALADTEGKIRNYYDGLNYEEVAKMAKQVVMILPRAPEKDAILKREKEK